jgi:dipeptidyl aminopeptidase/acylaminoacyl peptidase
MHTLADVAPGRICYLTNRRNGVAFDPVIRDLADGTERIINIGDHRFEEAAISPDGTFLENTSAYRRAYREREYGTLKDDREFLHEASPLTHIDDITAPLFIIHGANDPRVPLSEAEQIHAAMTARGRECELLVYGDEGHGLTKRANRADAMPRAFAFLARHLGG